MKKKNLFVGVSAIVLGSFIVLGAFGNGFMKFYLGTREERSLNDQKNALEVMKLMNQAQIYNSELICSISQLQLKQAAAAASVNKIAEGNSAILKEFIDIYGKDVKNQAVVLQNQLQYSVATEKIINTLQLVLPGNIKTMGKIEKSLRPLENSLGVIAQWKDSKFVPEQIGKSFHETYCSVADIRKSFADTELMLNHISQINNQKLSPFMKAYEKCLRDGIDVNTANMTALQQNAMAVQNMKKNEAVANLTGSLPVEKKQLKNVSIQQETEKLLSQLERNLAATNAKIGQLESSIKASLLLLINESLLGILCGIGFLLIGIGFCSQKD